MSEFHDSHKKQVCTVPLLVIVPLIIACASALGLVVHQRQVAAEHGDPNHPKPVWETDIAAGCGKAIALFNHAVTDMDVKVGYAIATYDPNDPNNPDWDWVHEQLFDEPEELYEAAIVDPSITYAPDANAPSGPGHFVAAAFANAPSGQDRNFRLLISQYHVAGGAQAQFDEWSVVAKRDSALFEGVGVDKPWHVFGGIKRWGEHNEHAGREYYLVWVDQPPPEDPNDPNAILPPEGYAYCRTVDGWTRWTDPTSNDPNDTYKLTVGGQPIMVGDQRITGGFCAQPACDPNAALYVAYIRDSSIRFLKGTDVNDDLPNDRAITEFR